MREKKELNVQIGARIKAAREEAGLTQEQLAEKAEVSPQYVSDLERGVVGLSVATLIRVCTTLGVSSDRLLFSREAGTRAVQLGERCAELSVTHFDILMEIVDRYMEAVQPAAGRLDKDQREGSNNL